MAGAHLKEMSDEALTHRMFDIERELVSARFKHSLGELENTAELRVLRREIARIQGEARRREVEREMPKGSLVQTHRTTYGGSASGSDSEQAPERGGFLKGIVDKLAGSD
jgi:ribosomal protein L29